MKRTFYLMIAGIAFLAACSTPPPSAPLNIAFTEGSGTDSIRMFFENYAKGDWSALRSVYHDTAAVYHNASEKMSADSIVSFHKARRGNYDNVEVEVAVPLDVDYKVGQLAGEHWRTAWAELRLTVKGTGEVVRLPMNIAWMMRDGKVVREHAFYNTLGLFQALTKAQQAAATKK